MKYLKTAAIVPIVALAGFVGSIASASAQDATMMRRTDKTHLSKRYHDNMVRRPLTVRRRVAAPVVAAGPAAPVVAAPIAAASTVVALPFQVLGNVFPGGTGPRKGGVTAVRYVNAGAETDKIDEGWAQPVPVDKSGPIYVVENGDPTISPLVFIGAPIMAAGSIAQLPFRILGAPVVPGTL